MNDDYAVLEERFVGLIQRHRTLIRSLCWHRTNGDVERCAELVQECYIALWRALPALRADLASWQERGWVYWRCRSVFSRRYRRRQRWWLPLDAVPDALLAEKAAADRERLEELAENLSPREQRYLQLLLEGYDTAEIAEQLHVGTDAVYKIRQSIIKKMKQNATPNSNGTD